MASKVLEHKGNVPLGLNTCNRVVVVDDLCKTRPPKALEVEQKKRH